MVRSGTDSPRKEVSAGKLEFWEVHARSGKDVWLQHKDLPGRRFVDLAELVEALKQKDDLLGVIEGCKPKPKSLFRRIMKWDRKARGVPEQKPEHFYRDLILKWDDIWRKRPKSTFSNPKGFYAFTKRSLYWFQGKRKPKKVRKCGSDIKPTKSFWKSSTITGATDFTAKNIAEMQRVFKQASPPQFGSAPEKDVTLSGKFYRSMEEHKKRLDALEPGLSAAGVELIWKRLYALEGSLRDLRERLAVPPYDPASSFDLEGNPLTKELKTLKKSARLRRQGQNKSSFKGKRRKKI